MEEAIVLYPSPLVGHLISMVELGKLLLTRQPSLSIHILITSVPYNSGSTSTNPHVREELLSISKNYTVHGLVVDFFCSAALSVAKELNIPAHYYFTSGAGVLSIFLYFPTIHNTTTKSLKDLKTLLHIPGVPPIPSTDMPVPMLEREDKPLKVPKDDAVTRNGTTLECLKWLDSQPGGSVVFLCFGSLGLFSKEQLREIAFGLERSGHRFLWVVRNPPSGKKNVALSAHDPNIDLDSLLPEGFLDRTEERGLVLKSWAPQVAVLNHPSVGGFVTHCGWNSVLEAVCAGVPLVAWPLYAEQRLNRILLVEEMKLALPMRESESGFVSAAEVEERVRGLMESEEGKLIRERTVGMKIAAKVASSEVGSSRVALSKLVESWKDK
ncbi:hypothetical protein OIU84_014397 [Salix udensis]|uniref:anthocyanidin 3-O-glucosyltransferase n=1 Tax=Salix udensis TaxID=889485 RepID=A0AAD6NR01_9ROSI|nr:hypothetical protein OIU84_014397 [Salix udensis]